MDSTLLNTYREVFKRAKEVQGQINKFQASVKAILATNAIDTEVLVEKENELTYRTFGKTYSMQSVVYFVKANSGFPFNNLISNGQTTFYRIDESEESAKSIKVELKSFDVDKLGNIDRMLHDEAAVNLIGAMVSDMTVKDPT